MAEAPPVHSTQPPEKPLHLHVPILTLRGDWPQQLPISLLHRVGWGGALGTVAPEDWVRLVGQSLPGHPVPSCVSGAGVLSLQGTDMQEYQGSYEPTVGAGAGWGRVFQRGDGEEVLRLPVPKIWVSRPYG